MRPHLWRRRYGKVPIQIVIDSIPLARGKILSPDAERQRLLSILSGHLRRRILLSVLLLLRTLPQALGSDGGNPNETGEATMKKSMATATSNVNVTLCVQLSENGQRNEIKKGRSGKQEVLIKGRIPPDDVDLFSGRRWQVVHGAKARLDSYHR
jgi:hypothetical protein